MTATFPDSEDDSGMPAFDRPIPRCGNGTLELGEYCDVALRNGMPGACPQGCSGRSGCLHQVVVGRACTLHCEEQEITEPESDDGCCPADANADSDSDCASVCGDGMRERAETCDPPDSCMKEADCTSQDACHTALYVGSPERCNARCEMRDVEACVDGDGCCPPGCSYDRDDDCARPQPPECDGTCLDAAVPTDCQSVHSGNSCETCDCALCQDQTFACLSSPQMTGPACDAIAHCAALNHCSGLDCYCGGLNVDLCRRVPIGPCVAEITAAAGGERDVYTLLATAVLADGALARAVNLMNCRRQNCMRACELR